MVHLAGTLWGYGIMLSKNEKGPLYIGAPLIRSGLHCRHLKKNKTTQNRDTKTFVLVTILPRRIV
jgi:hypothetical protein